MPFLPILISRFSCLFFLWEISCHKIPWFLVSHEKLRSVFVNAIVTVFHDPLVQLAPISRLSFKHPKTQFSCTRTIISVQHSTTLQKQDQFICLKCLKNTYIFVWKEALECKYLFLHNVEKLSHAFSARKKIHSI